MGRELKLRQLAKPLKEARKDPRVDEAVLFVEDLFGRKLKNEPNIIQVNDENRLKFLRLVREDYPARQANPFFTKSLKSKELIEEYEKLECECSARRSLEVIGSKKSENQKLESRLDEIIFGASRGIYLFEQDIIVTREGETSLIIHELIHAEDRLALDRENPMISIVEEGRATFGQAVFNWGKEDFDLDAFFIWSEHSSFRGIATQLRSILKEFGLRYLFGLIVEASKRSSIRREKLYEPFKRMLAYIGCEVGDPYLAFQITTKKQPKTKEELNDRTFYDKEIEKYQRLN